MRLNNSEAAIKEAFRITKIGYFTILPEECPVQSFGGDEYGDGKKAVKKR